MLLKTRQKARCCWKRSCEAFMVPVPNSTQADEPSLLCGPSVFAGCPLQSLPPGSYPRHQCCDNNSDISAYWNRAGFQPDHRRSGVRALFLCRLACLAILIIARAGAGFVGQVVRRYIVDRGRKRFAQPTPCIRGMWEVVYEDWSTLLEPGNTRESMKCDSGSNLWRTRLCRTVGHTESCSGGGAICGVVYGDSDQA